MIPLARGVRGQSRVFPFLSALERVITNIHPWKLLAKSFAPNGRPSCGRGDIAARGSAARRELGSRCRVAL